MSGETEQHPSGWTVDTLYALFQKQHDDLARMLDERYSTQVKAIDAAFLAQQTAMQTALVAAERAVQTALLAAEKAVTKAEIAADKRFESVNEFRAQLNDMVTTLISRVEADARFTALSDKIDAMTTREAQQFAEINKRLDTYTGERVGIADTHTGQKQNTSLVLAVVGGLVGIVGVAAAIITALTTG